MSGFDEGAIFYSSAIGIDQSINPDNRTEFKKRFREFLRTYHETSSFDHKYRDALKRNYNLKKFFLEVNLDDFNLIDAELHDKLKNQPAEFLPIFEEAAKEVAGEITRPLEGEEEEDVQIMLNPSEEPVSPRSLKSEYVSKLVTVSGIVVAASGVRVKAQKITIQCRSCRNSVLDIPMKPGFDGYMLPRKCNGAGDQPGQPSCGLDPFFIMPDKCKCVDIQTLKLQEASEDVPNGELPRHTQLYCDRYLCEKVSPGNRVTLTGIYSIRQGGQGKKASDKVAAAGIRMPYIRVVGIKVESESRTVNSPVTPEEEEQFRQFAARPDCYEAIAKSIAPSIYGSIDIKKSIACLLFGGSRKRHPDGLIRRGDINLLFLGDPGTAKSQLLKFVERVAPVAVYTSGKGSSAAGLTASVVRDAGRNFVLEGGAMVLADGGVVCIDEFDKMREDDRVAIHEAMEQQTISIAKAGITTTLNTRCSVLAAANSVFGRWDDTKGDDNIDFMPTILSRFDMIYIVKDEHDFQKDTTLAKHVISVHMNAAQVVNEVEGEVTLNFLKKYIAYCRARCGPRISAEGAEKLRNRYVLMRSGSRQHEQDTMKRMSIPITVRQLEAVIRISESLAKMRLMPFAGEEQVDEALRLFQVSTLEAAMSGSLAGAEGFTTVEQQDTLNRIEKQIKKRFPIGAQISEQTIINEFAKQKFGEVSVKKVLHAMLRRGELQHRLQRKVLYRIR